MSKKGTAIPKPVPESIPLDACCSDGLENSIPAAFFKALGDPNRVALLARLAVCGRPATVSEIACCLPIDLSVVSRHLAQLREAGILESEKRGKEVLYFVRYQEVASLLRTIADSIEQCCPPAPGHKAVGFCKPDQTQKSPQAQKRKQSVRRIKS